MSFGVHVVPVGEEHTTVGLDCWCCPQWLNTDADDDTRLSRPEADALLLEGRDVVVVHRSEDDSLNDLTGPVPWLSPARPA